MSLELLLSALRFIYLRDLSNDTLIIFAVNLFFELILRISLQFETSCNALLVLLK